MPRTTWVSDDITFCLNDKCKVTACYRNQENIHCRDIPHSFAELEGTESCPSFYDDGASAFVHKEWSKNTTTNASGKTGWHDLREDPGCLPVEGKPVLIVVEGRVFEASLYSGVFDGGRINADIGDVVAWMPMPRWEKK